MMNYFRLANELLAVLMKLKPPALVFIDGRKAEKHLDSGFCFPYA